jgi:hypothetical protein
MVASLPTYSVGTQEHRDVQHSVDKWVSEGAYARVLASTSGKQICWPTLDRGIEELSR